MHKYDCKGYLPPAKYAHNIDSLITARYLNCSSVMSVPYTTLLIIVLFIHTPNLYQLHMFRIRLYIVQFFANYLLFTPHDLIYV